VRAGAVTKKTHEAAGFSLGIPSALLVITGSSAGPKWVKTRKTRGFLGYWRADNGHLEQKQTQKRLKSGFKIIS
jgi:hypothetical protein